MTLLDLPSLEGTKMGDHLDHCLKVSFVVQFCTHMGGTHNLNNKERSYGTLNHNVSKLAPLWGGPMTLPDFRRYSWVSPAATKVGDPRTFF